MEPIKFLLKHKAINAGIVREMAGLFRLSLEAANKIALDFVANKNYYKNLVDNGLSLAFDEDFGAETVEPVEEAAVEPSAAAAAAAAAQPSAAAAVETSAAAATQATQVDLLSGDSSSEESSDTDDEVPAKVSKPASKPASAAMSPASVPKIVLKPKSVLMAQAEAAEANKSKNLRAVIACAEAAEEDESFDAAAAGSDSVSVGEPAESSELRFRDLTPERIEQIFDDMTTDIGIDPEASVMSKYFIAKKLFGMRGKVMLTVIKYFEAFKTRGVAGIAEIWKAAQPKKIKTKDPKDPKDAKAKKSKKPVSEPAFFPPFMFDPTFLRQKAAAAGAGGAAAAAAAGPREHIGFMPYAPSFGYPFPYAGAGFPGAGFPTGFPGAGFAYGPYGPLCSNCCGPLGHAGAAGGGAAGGKKRSREVFDSPSSSSSSSSASSFDAPKRQKDLTEALESAV